MIVIVTQKISFYYSPKNRYIENLLYVGLRERL